MTEKTFNTKELESRSRTIAVETTCSRDENSRENLAKLKQEIQDLESLGHRLALDLECLILATDLPASTRWWSESMESLEAWRAYHNENKENL